MAVRRPAPERQRWRKRLCKMSPDDTEVVAAVAAIRGGPSQTLHGYCRHPELATARIDGVGPCSTWPPIGPVISLRGSGGRPPWWRRGAGRECAVFGRHAETPLHRAASSDDVAVLDALLDAGEPGSAGSVIDGGPPWRTRWPSEVGSRPSVGGPRRRRPSSGKLPHWAWPTGWPPCSGSGTDPSAEQITNAFCVRL